MSYTKSAFEGLAWPVVKQSGRLLSVAGNAGLAEFDSSAAETVAKLHAYFDKTAAGSELTGYVYPSSSLPLSPTTDTFRPNEDRQVVDWQDQDAGTTDIYTSVDEATLDTSDWIRSTTTSARYEFHVGSSGGTTNPRVVMLRIVAIAEHENFNDQQDVLASVQDLGSGGVSDRGPKTVAGPEGQVRLEFEWSTNPFTQAEWTSAEVAEFDDSTSSGKAVFLKAETGTEHLRVYQLWMEVESVASPDAEGTVTVDNDGWAEIAFDADWSKGSGTTYSVVMRKDNTAGRCVWPLLDSGGDCPHVSWQSRVPTVEDRLITDTGDKQTGVHPLIFELGDGTVSADSQPYALLQRESVHDGRTVEQEITPSGDLTAGWLRVVAACHPDTAADLSVELQGVDTLTVSPDDLPDPESPRKLQQVDGALPTTASTGTGQQRVILSSTEPEATGWEVAVLDADAPPISAETAGFGGTTDQATVDGTEDDDLDAPAVYDAIPSAPTGFSATAGTAQVDLAWDATSLGSSFDRYEILRAGVVIAEITSESTTSLTDTGALQGSQETWEVRVRDTDGVVSQTASDTATATALSNNTHRFSSLHDSSIDLDVASLTSGGMSWSFPQDRSELALMGRANTKVLTSGTDRGDVEEIAVDLSGSNARSLFDGLLAVRDADVPQVVVTDAWGSRWYASIDVSEGSLRAGLVSRGRAPVRIVEIADTPTPAELS